MYCTYVCILVLYEYKTNAQTHAQAERRERSWKRIWCRGCIFTCVGCRWYVVVGEHVKRTGFRMYSDWMWMWLWILKVEFELRPVSWRARAVYDIIICEDEERVAAKRGKVGWYALAHDTGNDSVVGVHGQFIKNQTIQFEYEPVTGELVS